MTKWSVVPFDETQVDSTTETVTLQGGNSNQRIRYSIPTLGQSVVPVHKISDIPLVNGFRQFEQDKVYRFVEEISISETLLVPAGWNGYIVGMHNPLTNFDYTGTGTSLRTLTIIANIDTIVSAAAGAKITVTTLVAHTLLDGQFVNITGTTIPAYNQQKLLVSNITEFTFDVQIPFVGNATGGAIDAGYDAINIMDMAFTNATTGMWIDVRAANTSSIFRYNNIKAKGFANLGRITGGIIIGYDGDFDTAHSDSSLGPLNFGNVDKAIVSTTTITQTDASAIGAELLILTGALTRDITLDKMQFNASDASQFPMRIPSNLAIAKISITNSRDNNIATDFFSTVGTALDQTDPKVFTFKNGIRPDSMVSAEVGFTNIAIPIEVTIATQDAPVVIGGTQFISNNLERATANSAGQITNISKRPKKYPITLSGLIEKVGGGTTDIGLLIIKNGSLVLTNTFEIPHSVNAGIIQVSATRDFELAENDTIELAVVNFSGTANISVSQANISYSVGS